MGFKWPFRISVNTFRWMTRYMDQLVSDFLNPLATLGLKRGHSSMDTNNSEFKKLHLYNFEKHCTIVDQFINTDPESKHFATF